jgi:hypothetical protein
MLISSLILDDKFRYNLIEVRMVTNIEILTLMSCALSSGIEFKLENEAPKTEQTITHGL